MYVKITDKGECFSTTMEYVNGVYANRTEWAKYNFYPKNGMVGEVVKRTPSAYIVKIMDGIYVPMTRKGIVEISYNEYKEGLSYNVCNGMDERQKRINDGVDAFNARTGYEWQKLPDMREAFKQDIINNINKLTCDLKYNIYMPDLEKSAVIYAADICLEYQNKSGRSLHPMVVDDIANQVCDVYMELFIGQFRQTNKNQCIHNVKSMVANPATARTTIDKYYESVNLRYNIRS